MPDQAQSALLLTGYRDPVTRQVMLMTPDTCPEYQKFKKAYVASFKTVDMVEEQLAHSIADAQWRLNQIRALQNNLFALELSYPVKIDIEEPNAKAAAHSAQRIPRKAPTLRELSMYEQRIHKQFHNDLQALRDMIAARHTEENETLDQAAQLLKLEKSKTPKGAALKYCPSQDGYAHPIEVVEKHLHIRDRRREARMHDRALKAAAS